MGNSKVFISYSSQEFHLVQTICMILEKNDIICWIAPRDIPIGSNYAAEIPEAIKECEFFLVALSNTSQKSPWVAKEISLALTYRKIILPIVLEQCELTEIFNFYLTDVQRYEVVDCKIKLNK